MYRYIVDVTRCDHRQDNVILDANKTKKLVHTKLSCNNKTMLFSGFVAAEHLHLQHQVVQSDRRVVKACRPVDRQQKESSLQSGVKTS